MNRSHVKAYWYRAGRGTSNFGDRLTPLLLNHFGIRCEWTPPETAQLTGIGSILEKVPDTFSGMIWSSGFIGPNSTLSFRNARALAVRGRLTLERLHRPPSEDVVLGDAGLLCDELVPQVSKRWQLGIVPHYVDADDPLLKRLAGSSSEVTIIDVAREPLEVIRAIAECRHIISSSLHGLILADSLGIPNRWLELNQGSQSIVGGRFKFRDYYSVFGLAPEPLALQSEPTLPTLLEAIPPFARPGIDTIKERLRQTIDRIREEHPPPSKDELTATTNAQAEWRERLRQLQTTLARHIPPGSQVLIADDDQLRFQLLSIRTTPFLERDGTYWGPPGTDEEAIAEVNRVVVSGVEWFVIAWPMFWLLDRFDSVARYLAEHFETRARDQSVIILRARERHI